EYWPRSATGSVSSLLRCGVAISSGGKSYPSLNASKTAPYGSLLSSKSWIRVLRFAGPLVQWSRIVLSFLWSACRGFGGFSFRTDCGVVEVKEARRLDGVTLLQE